MSSVFKKTIFSLIALLYVPYASFALDTEYKNSLNKVELKQTSDSSYDVNLYLQKKFSEPVKVIKKNDLNYYILLPETKNATDGISKNGSDITDASANSHKYAGADVNNGYTKININTTKPINFNINVKNTSDMASRARTVNAAVRVTEESTPLPKIQKKNSDTQIPQKQKQQVNLKQKKETVATPTIVNIKPTSTKTDLAKKPVQNSNKKVVLQNQPQQKETIKQTVKQPVKQTLKQEQPKKKVVQEPIKTTVKPIKETPKEDISSLPVPPVLNTMDESAQKLAEAAIDEQLQQEQTEQTNFDEIDTTFDSSELDENEVQIPELPSKNNFISKVNEYGLSVNDLIFMLVAGLVSIIALILLLRKPNQSNAKLKTKADLIGKLDKTERFVPKKVKQPIKDQQGRYFVFDKNVKQTAFMDPATSENKKYYELSNYDPDINVKYGSEAANKVNKESSEYDIIQKILKEDSLVEIAPGEFEPKIYSKQPAIPKEEPTAPAQTQVSAQKEATGAVLTKQKPEVKKQTQSEPIVLSSVEIAPERGFMVVSYNDNINLMGYIFDDVFALYNFKRDKLRDTEIKFRLSDKDDKGTNFIVKVDDSKVVVRVTKSQMNLLVVM